MSILIDKSTRLIVQGITGRDGLFHAKKMKEYGTHVVGGTSPGKGGTDVDGIPVFMPMIEDFPHPWRHAHLSDICSTHESDPHPAMAKRRKILTCTCTGS